MYRLHSIILSRSPYLAHLMSTMQPNVQRAIYVPLDHDREVTPDVRTFSTPDEVYVLMVASRALL